MEIRTVSYTTANGWSEALPPLDSPATLVLVFGSSSMASIQQPFDDLLAAYPNAVLAGCSSAGEILDTEIHDESLVVAITQFRNTELKMVNVALSSAEASYASGQQLMRRLMAEDLKGLFVLSEGLSVNGSRLISGVNSLRPESVVVTGGLAGDGDRFENTWVLVDGKPQAGFVTAVGFYGEHVKIGHGSKGGWDYFGPERIVTNSSDNVLFELDGKPALTLYKEYLGELAAELPASALRFPLTIKDMPGAEKTLVRTVLAVDEENQSMTFAGDIPKHATVQLMRANIDDLVTGAEDAAQMTLKNGANEQQPVLSIAISCVGRRIVMGEFSEDEIEATLDVLPENTRQIGFYSYGELSPHASGNCDLHNQTMTLTTVYEQS